MQPIFARLRASISTSNKMATYAIGDLQGCHTEFRQLLELLEFNPARDKLWLVGDLVNRGSDSLAVLRLIKSLGDAAMTVLGNHDLHLLSVAAGVSETKRGDTLAEILAAPDREELLFWLRHRPLVHLENNHLLVHAGLLPQWTVAQTIALAHEAETVLRGENYVDFFQHMYGNTPNCWDESLVGNQKLRLIINALTRLRICTPQGEMEFKYKGEIAHIPEGYLPWFDAPNRQSASVTVIFGHWSALGLKLCDNLCALDTGCLWGGKLSAVRLEDRALFQVRSRF